MMVHLNTGFMQVASAGITTPDNKGASAS